MSPLAPLFLEGGIMAKFYVEITETLIKQVEVEAESPEEAERIVRDQYRNGEIEIDYQDFFDWDTFVLPEVGGTNV